MQTESNAKIESLSYHRFWRITMRIENADDCAFSRMKTTTVTLRASVNSEPAIDLCMKKWGSNNIT